MKDSDGLRDEVARAAELLPAVQASDEHRKDEQVQRIAKLLSDVRRLPELNQR